MRLAAVRQVKNGRALHAIRPVNPCWFWAKSGHNAPRVRRALRLDHQPPRDDFFAKFTEDEFLLRIADGAGLFQADGVD